MPERRDTTTEAEPGWWLAAPDRRVLGLIPLLGQTLLAYGLYRIGVNGWRVACWWLSFGLLGVMADARVQRFLGGGRLDGRDTLRMSLGLAVCWIGTVAAGVSFAFAASTVMIAALHVHVSGWRSAGTALRLGLAGTLLAMAVNHAGLIPGLIRSPLAFDLTAIMIAFPAAFSMLHLGNTAREREALTGRLQQAERRFRALVQNSADVVLVLDEDGTVSYASPASTAVLGRSPEELTGHPAARLVADADAAQFAAALAEVRDAAARTVRWEGHHATRTGWLEFSARDLRADPAVGGVVLHVRDVTERREFLDRLAYDADHDALTGALSRGAAEQALARLLVRPQAYGGVAVIACDLDGFKKINDQHGHAAGDEVLRAVTARLRAVLRPADVIARMGGDEFVVAALGTATAEAAQVVVERIRAEVLRPIVLQTPAGPVTVSVGVSIGVSLTGSPAAEPARALHEADRAMYADKRSRQVTLAPPG